MFTKLLVDIVRSSLRSHLSEMVSFPWGPSNQCIMMKSELAKLNLESGLKCWKEKTVAGPMRSQTYTRSSCGASVGGSKESCISPTGAGILFNQMMGEQIGNIGRLFAKVFME